MRLSSSSPRDVVDPVVETHDIQGGGTEDALQFGLGLSAITATAQFEDSRGLRDGALDAGTLVVEGLEFRAVLAGSRLFEGFVERARLDLKSARAAFGAGAGGSKWTGLAVGLGKGDVDDVLAIAAVVALAPALGVLLRCMPSVRGRLTQDVRSADVKRLSEGRWEAVEWREEGRG
jgi:hypothetical protein